MLNFAEQTGSGAVIVVWSFLNMDHFYLIYTVELKCSFNARFDFMYSIPIFGSTYTTYVRRRNS